MLVISSISLSACSTVSGKIPEKGPTMEEVYDSMEAKTEYRAKAYPTVKRKTLPINVTENTFHKLPNPELKMYVYPHFAGKDQVPIPGYYTTFNAYTQEHYALPNEA
jgi:conjugative transfer region lipoprotein (TIGR03751 family)